MVLIFQETAEHANKLSLLSIEITNLLVEVERLGELGEVQQAMAKTEEVDKLKERKRFELYLTFIIIKLYEK